MSRYRLEPAKGQVVALREHCAHARFIWNLALEQTSWWRPGRGPTPGFAEQCRQLTEARRENDWLRSGSVIVQQQALKDFSQAMTNFHSGTHALPTWRKAGQHEGFRIVAVQAQHLRQLNARWSAVLVPKVGWVRFRRSRALGAAKSYRITLDRAGRWHIAFAVIPAPIAGPGSGEVVGVDRGVIVSATLSTGEMLRVPRPGRRGRQKMARLQRKLRHARRGSNRRSRVRLALARAEAREVDTRKDWAEKASTDIARRFDVIRVEDLPIRNIVRSAKGTLAEPGSKVRQKAGLNRAVGESGWGILVRRLEEKAPGRVEKINPAYTSQRCSVCGHVAKESRESQSRFCCVACGFACHADVNAAINIAAGHAVTARGGFRVAGPVNREPQAA